MSFEPLNGEIMPPGAELDPRRIEALAMQFFEVVGAHYARSPRGINTVCEILNALAVVTGSVIRGTREDNEDAAGAEPFFRDALNLNLKIVPEEEEDPWRPTSPWGS